jgi:hypothetical protein
LQLPRFAWKNAIALPASPRLCGSVEKHFVGIGDAKSCFSLYKEPGPIANSILRLFHLQGKYQAIEKPL